MGHCVIGREVSDINNEHWTRDGTIPSVRDLLWCESDRVLIMADERAWNHVDHSVSDSQDAIRTHGVISCKLMPSTTNLISPAMSRVTVSCGVHGGVAFHHYPTLAERIATKEGKRGRAMVVGIPIAVSVLCE